jgi:hypothetical protein
MCGDIHILDYRIFLTLYGSSNRERPMYQAYLRPNQLNTVSSLLTSYLPPPSHRIFSEAHKWQSSQATTRHANLLSGWSRCGSTQPPPVSMANPCHRGFWPMGWA